MQYRDVTIIYKPSNRCVEILRVIEDELKNHGYRPLAKWVEEARREDVERADLVISLGGDGSLLKTARLIKERNPIILPIPCGRRTALYEEDVDPAEAVRRVIEGRFYIEHMARITVDVGGSRHYALNELLVLNHHAGHVLIMRIDIRTPFMASTLILEGDGVIASTPPGSPAYNLSAGGPFICSQVYCMVVTPLNPMNLNIRPIVLDPFSRIVVTPRDYYDLYIDGAHIDTYPGGSSVSVEADGLPIRLARFTLREDRLRHVLGKRILRFG